MQLHFTGRCATGLFVRSCNLHPGKPENAWTISCTSWHNVDLLEFQCNKKFRMNDRKIELLAPAGSYESLQAAIVAGADSIYFGVEQLNMRARSSSSSAMVSTGRPFSVQASASVLFPLQQKSRWYFSNTGTAWWLLLTMDANVCSAIVDIR